MVQLNKPAGTGADCRIAKGHGKNVEKEPSRRQAKKVIAATNNHYKGKAAVNAIDLKRLLGIKNNPVPDELAKTYPELNS